MIKRLFCLALPMFSLTWSAHATEPRDESSCEGEMSVKYVAAIRRLHESMARQPERWRELFGPTLGYESFRVFFADFLVTAKGGAISLDDLYAMDQRYRRETIRRYVHQAIREGWILKTGRGEGRRFYPAPHLLETYLEFMRGPGALVYDLTQVDYSSSTEAEFKR